MGILKRLLILLIVAAIGVGIHAGYMFGKPIMDYKLFKGEAEELIRYDFNSEADVNERYIKLMESRNIPVLISDEDAEKTLEVWPSGDYGYEVFIKYSITVDYYGLYKKKYDYKVELKK